MSVLLGIFNDLLLLGNVVLSILGGLVNGSLCIVLSLIKLLRGSIGLLLGILSGFLGFLFLLFLLLLLVLELLLLLLLLFLGLLGGGLLSGLLGLSGFSLFLADECEVALEDVGELEGAGNVNKA